MKSLVCLGLTVAFLAMAGTLPAQPGGPQQLARMVAPVIARVRGVGATGKEALASGVFISPMGHLVTTDLAVYGAKEIHVRANIWKSERKASFILRDPASRLVLLKVPTEEKVPCVGLASFAPTEAGTTTLVLSFTDPGTNKVEARVSKLGQVCNPLKLAGVTGKGLLDFEAVEMPAQFHALCAGGPCVDGRTRFLGIVNYIVNPKGADGKPGAVCYLIPARLITAFVLSVVDPQMAPVFDEVNPGAKQHLPALANGFKSFEGGSSLPEKVAFRKLRQSTLGRLLALRQKAERAVAAQRGEDEKRFAGLPRKGRRLHEQHPDWPFEFVEAVCNRKLLQGMTKDMVRAMFGSPQDTNFQTQSDGVNTETWCYHNRKMFGGVTKARYLLFAPDGRLVKWRHDRGWGGNLKPR